MLLFGVNVDFSRTILGQQYLSRCVLKTPTQTSVILQVHCYGGEMLPLFSGRSHSNEVPFFNRGARQEPTSLASTRPKGRASVLVSLVLVLYRQPHLLTREAFLSRWPLCRPLTNALPLCVGVPVTSAEHAYLFLHFFFFFNFF